MLLIGTATTILTTVGGYVTTHWGGVTTEQLKSVKDDVAAVVARQQSDGDVAARRDAETKSQLATVSAKVDKLSAAVLGRKKAKRSDAEP